MSPRYEPKDHIQPLVAAPRAEGIFDKKEITIQSYQTTVPFDYDALESGLSGAWLTPTLHFGVYSHFPSTGKDALNVVLGLQDELAIRAYDYDERRPLWYSWQNAVVETVNVHYFRDEEGLLRFTTTGGGQRITDKLLDEFHSTFLQIPKAAVSKRQFDLEKLRDLCFNEYVERLYMIRFAEPSVKEYQSIDHALFQSRQYIDPEAERLKEIRTDTKVTIESFDSDVPVVSDELASEIHVRFFIRGLTGSLRLRFPKITYKKQLTTPEEQTRAFYRLADATVSAILDDDYYTHQRRTLNELDVDLGMYPEFVDLAPFREVLTSAEARREFISGIDVGETWPHWCPHLRALDELVQSDVVAAEVAQLFLELVSRDPGMASRVLAVCQADAAKHRVGGLLAGAIAGELPAIPSEMRTQVEQSLLSWAVDRDVDTWDVDAVTGEFGALGLKWRIEDIAFDVLPIVIWKLVGVMHARLTASTDDVGALLRKYDWCVTVANELPSHHFKSPAALRLIAEKRVPKSASEAERVLKNPVSSFRDLDEAVLNQFGLPLWPLLTASRRDGKVRLTNDGIGSALAARVQAGNDTPEDDEEPSAFDLSPGDTVSLPLTSDHAAIDVQFEKLGRTYRVAVTIDGEEPSTVVLDNRRIVPATINRTRLAAQRECRKRIDPEGIVIGSSPALLEIFEQIHHANLTEGLPAVLLLGEPGVGKTHIAELLHKSSTRATKPFVVVNAGGGGGDINIQRGEWIGYGKGHGIQHIDKNGQPGHLMKASGGTLFVDEFASFSHDLQVNFLSVLEKKSVQKVGGESFSPDVRCIFATNADIEKLIGDGALRRDLLDRIPVRFRIPPLRERRSDILLLGRHFAGDHEIAPRCLIALLRYDWPGNVRELRSKVAAAMARMKSDGKSTLDVTHFDLPGETASVANGLDEEACRRELWVIADEIARNEGFEHGAGLQRRAGEIMGVGDAQASKMYQAYGLAQAASA